MLEKVKKNILISIAISGALYLGLSIYADYNKVIGSLEKFPWLLLPVLLLLSFSNYIMRFIKWHYYLNLLKIKIKVMDSFSVFTSGLIMSVTPGKMGELLKSYLVKQITGVSISRTAPIIFAERITDFLSLVLIAVLGSFSYHVGEAVSISVAVFFILLVVLIGQRSWMFALFRLTGRLKFVNKHIEKVLHAYESAYEMLKIGPVLKMIVVSLCSWFFECFGYFIILRNFHIDVDMLWASFSYAFGTIVGAITMLPGGLGATEFSLTSMILSKGADKNVAVASTFLIRIVTLWFAVLVGIISVALYQKRFGKINTEQQ